MPKRRLYLPDFAPFVIDAMYSPGKYVDNSPARPTPWIAWAALEGSTAPTPKRSYEQILEERVGYANAAALWWFAVYKTDASIGEVDDTILSDMAESLGVPVDTEHEASNDIYRDMRVLLNPVYISELFRNPKYLVEAYKQTAALNFREGEVDVGEIFQIFAVVGNAAVEMRMGQHEAEQKQAMDVPLSGKMSLDELDIPDAIKSKPIAAKEVGGPDAFENYLQTRTKKIGASTIGYCFPLNEDGSKNGFGLPVDFWEDKKGLRKPMEVTPTLIVGSCMQSVVEKGLMEHPKMKAVNAVRLDDPSEVLYEHRLPQYSYIAATPDVVIEMDNPDVKGERIIGLVECKTTSNWTSVYQYPDPETGVLVYHPPMNVIMQLQTQMDVMGLTHGFVAVFPYGNSLPRDRSDFYENVWVWGPVKYDPVIVDNIRLHAEHMQRCLDENIHPLEDEVYYKQFDSYRLGETEWTKYVEAEKGVVVASEEMVEMHTTYKDLTARETEIKKQKKEIATKVKSELGDAQQMKVSLDDDKPLWTWKCKTALRSEDLWQALEDDGKKVYYTKNDAGAKEKDWNRTLAENPDIFHSFVGETPKGRTLRAK